MYSQICFHCQRVEILHTWHHFNLKRIPNRAKHIFVFYTRLSKSPFQNYFPQISQLSFFDKIITQFLGFLALLTISLC